MLRSLTSALTSGSQWLLSTCPSFLLFVVWATLRDVLTSSSRNHSLEISYRAPTSNDPWLTRSALPPEILWQALCSAWRDTAQYQERITIRFDSSSISRAGFSLPASRMCGLANLLNGHVLELREMQIPLFFRKTYRAQCYPAPNLHLLKRTFPSSFVLMAAGCVKLSLHVTDIFPIVNYDATAGRGLVGPVYNGHGAFWSTSQTGSPFRSCLRW